MVQLTDDCFQVGASAMSIEAAIALATERLAAEDVFALNDLPPFANSAVDGYAVRHADLAPEGETLAPVSGRLPAGASAKPAVAGQAVRIFTGAAMPPGADTVFMQEDVSVEGASVRLPGGLKRGANMRPPGEDIASGELIIPAGRRLKPQDVALAVAAGHREIAVRLALRVAVFSTGDELVEPGEALRPSAIYDSNRIMLAALLGRLGAEVVDFGILPDDPEILAARLAGAAGGVDLILTSGGVSLGEEDHVKTAVEAVGQLVFWKVAIKPGRPLAMGMIKGVPFVGLPGNPAAVYTTFVMFVRPLIAHLAGAAPQPLKPLKVRSAFNSKKRQGRREYVRVNVSRAADGVLEARRFPREGAALLTSITTSDGIAEVMDDAAQVQVGDILNFYPHEALLQP